MGWQDRDMNALFGGGIKVFLPLLQAQHAVRQDHGDGADGRDRNFGSAHLIAGHDGVRFM